MIVALGPEMLWRYCSMPSSCGDAGATFHGKELCRLRQGTLNR